MTSPFAANAKDVPLSMYATRDFVSKLLSPKPTPSMGMAHSSLPFSIEVYPMSPVYLSLLIPP